MVLSAGHRCYGGIPILRMRMVREGYVAALCSRMPQIGASSTMRLQIPEKKMALRDPKATWQSARGSKLGKEPPFALRRCSASGAYAIHMSRVSSKLG